MKAYWFVLSVVGFLALACGRSGLGARRPEAGVSADVVTTQANPGDSGIGGVDASPARRGRDTAVADFGAGEIDGTDATVVPWELTCGNGYIDRGESCDDGNRWPGDGCDRNCCIEFNLMCCSNLGCWEAQHRPCHCGNGILELFEQCDDGNLTFGDGCNGYCEIETGLCGNGKIDPGEECDDGNLEFGPDPYGDGCDPSCRREHIGCFASDAGA
jgi:cysteine-rich repeat protein